MKAADVRRLFVYLLLGTMLLAAGMGLGAWIFLGRGNAPFDVDALWSASLAASRSSVLLWVSYAMNWLGGGWFGVFAVPLGIAAALLVLRRPWAALYFLAASIASAGCVQALKRLFGRARPEDIIVTSDFGSFPSGHVANAATIAVALFVLFPRVWVGVAGILWTLLMAFSRTYLGAHWLSDTAGGAFVGAGAALLVAAGLMVLLEREYRGGRAAGPLSP